MGWPKMKTIALIPARSGSQRVKNKNIRFLNGHPLIDWSISVAIQLHLDAVILSTNDEKYMQIGQKLGAKPLKRPENLSNSESGDLEVVRHCLENFPADLIVYLRPTTPFRSLTVCENAIKSLNEGIESASGLRSVEEMGESAFKNFTLRPGPYLVPLRGAMADTDRPNQMIEKTYKGNGYVDIIKAETIEKGLLFGDNCIGFITPHTIEIDTEDDFKYAEYFASKNNWREEIVFK